MKHFFELRTNFGFGLPILLIVLAFMLAVAGGFFSYREHQEQVKEEARQKELEAELEAITMEYAENTIEWKIHSSEYATSEVLFFTRKDHFCETEVKIVRPPNKDQSSTGPMLFYLSVTPRRFDDECGYEIHVNELAAKFKSEHPSITIKPTKYTSNLVGKTDFSPSGTEGFFEIESVTHTSLIISVPISIYYHGYPNLVDLRVEYNENGVIKGVDIPGAIQTSLNPDGLASANAVFSAARLLAPGWVGKAIERTKSTGRAR